MKKHVLFYFCLQLCRAITIRIFCTVYGLFYLNDCFYYVAIIVTSSIKNLQESWDGSQSSRTIEALGLVQCNVHRKVLNKIN